VLPDTAGRQAKGSDSSKIQKDNWPGFLSILQSSGILFEVPMAGRGEWNETQGSTLGGGGAGGGGGGQFTRGPSRLGVGAGETSAMIADWQDMRGEVVRDDDNKSNADDVATSHVHSPLQPAEGVEQESWHRLRPQVVAELHYGAVWCNVVQYGAVCCGELRCGVLQCAAEMDCVRR